MSDTWWVDPQWCGCLEARGLKDFRSAWTSCSQPTEALNRRKQGWAAVHRITLDKTPDRCPAIYLKQQQNYFTRSLRRPLGEPVAERELRNLRAFAAEELPVPRVVCHGRHRDGDQLDTLLGIAELNGYLPLDEALLQLPDAGLQRAEVIRGAGTLIGRLHQNRWEYRCLYPKHVYVQLVAGSPQNFSFIDLEKARKRVRVRYGSLRDLATFVNRCAQWQDEDWQVFFRGYFAKEYTDAKRDAIMARIQARRARRG